MVGHQKQREKELKTEFFWKKQSEISQRKPKEFETVSILKISLI
jgi:hypothetical protein